MADTIQLKLLENKSIVAEINGKNYAYEGGYNIVAGDQNATEFEIVSIPTKYSGYSIMLSMTNSRGQNVMPPDIINNKFILPIGMAIAGYGQILISLHGINDKGENVSVYFLPLKIKVANTSPKWTDGAISGTVAIGKVETLAPGSQAYATNSGTSTDIILNLGIPQGEKGAAGKDALPIKILGNIYYDPSLSYAWSTADLLQLPDFNNTEEGTAYLVDDNEAKGQYDLYIHNYEATEWVIVNNWGGIPGQKGDKGDKGNDGLGIYESSGTYTTATTQIERNTLKGAVNNPVQYGATIIDRVGNVFTVDSISSDTVVYVSYIFSIKGNKGDSGRGIVKVENLGTIQTPDGKTTINNMKLTYTDGTTGAFSINAQNGQDGASAVIPKYRHHISIQGKATISPFQGQKYFACFEYENEDHRKLNETASNIAAMFVSLGNFQAPITGGFVETVPDGVQLLDISYNKSVYMTITRIVVPGMNSPIIQPLYESNESITTLEDTVYEVNYQFD